MPRLPRPTAPRPLLAVVLALFAVALLAPAPPAGAQGVCGLADRPEFAGHLMPLDAPVTPPSLATTDAFPGLPGFAFPVFLTGAGDDSGRLFVVEQGGRIWLVTFDTGTSSWQRTLYLDLSNEVAFVGEGGLLGLAFDPAFASNGHFYVDYTLFDPGCGFCFSVRVERFTAPSPSATSVDASTAPRTVLAAIPQPNDQNNHNGGMIAFGPDGYLYVAVGDGGGQADPTETGQDISDPLAAILRLDATDGSAAPGNPFESTPGADARVYHYGLRNPWRFSFDRAPPHDLWIGDVGEGAWEEVDFAPAGVAGLNFGWDDCEGAHDFEGGGCGDPTTSVLPVLEYAHIAAASITGGYVYRGTAVPDFFGHYLYADFIAGTIFAWDRVSVDPITGIGQPVQVATVGRISSFGEDDAGELYVVQWSDPGRILRFVPAGGGGGNQFPALLSQTALFEDTAALVAAPGMVEYDVNAPLWSDRADKRRWLALPAGARVDFTPEGALSLPVGTVFVKHFELPAPGGGVRRVETRVLVHQTPGWTGVTYRWDDTQTDAMLLKTGLAEAIDVDVDGSPVQQTWLYPAPDGGCLACHTGAAGRVLGFRGPQLNRDFPYPGGFDNQLHALGCGDVFVDAVHDPTLFPAVPRLDDGSASRQRRARAYLDSNCAICHQPGGPAPGGMDMRRDTLLSLANLIGVGATQGDLGLPNPDRIRAGAHDESVLWARLATTLASERMPPGTRVPDDPAVSLFRDWIDFDLGTVDTDEDGVPDASDLCPADADPGQADGNGNGVGDACDPTTAADLTATPVGPAQTSLGAVVALQALVANGGPGDAGASQARLYLSADLAFDPAVDRLVDSCATAAVPSGQQTSCSPSVAVVPADLVVLQPGETADFHWVACADAYDLVLEGDEGNNCTVDPAIVAVPEPRAAWLQAAALAGLAWMRRAWLRRRRA